MTIDQRVVVSPPNADAYRAFEVALDLHLDVGWHDLPAGTEVLVGYADAGISQVTAAPDRGGKAAPPAPPTGTTTTTPSGEGGVSLLPTAPLPSDIAGEPGIADGGPPGSDATPPGGYWLDRHRRRDEGGAARPTTCSRWPWRALPERLGAPRADTRFNQGVDLFAPLGTPVLAVHDGTLVQVGWSNIGGRQEWLRDSDGNLFYYGQLSAYAPVAKTGAQVHAGDVIGFLGDSGTRRARRSTCTSRSILPASGPCRRTRT